MVSRLKFDIGNEIDKQLSYLPTYIWESDSTTFCDLNMAGGQFIQKVGEWLRKYGHSDDNIRKRVFGFSEKPLYLSYIKSNPSLIGTFDIYNENITMKFDVQLGNDPYQKSVGPKKTEPIWDDLIIKRISLLNEGGFLALIHPSGWRNVDGRFKHIQDLFKSKQIHYLEMHDTNDGLKTFGYATRYDLYVIQNLLSYKKSKIKFEDGIEMDLDVSKMNFIPNRYSKVIENIIYNGVGDKVNVLYSRSDYGSDKPHMNNEKTNEFKYPCIQNVNVNDDISCTWYSNTKSKGHFGIPKVIFGRKSSGVFFDKNGDYGLSQDCAAIIDSNENLEKIFKVLKSENFIEFMKYFDFGGVNDRYNRKIIAEFKKDFWKEFI